VGLSGLILAQRLARQAVFAAMAAAGSGTFFAAPGVRARLIQPVFAPPPGPGYGARRGVA